MTGTARINSPVHGTREGSEPAPLSRSLSFGDAKSHAAAALPRPSRYAGQERLLTPHLAWCGTHRRHGEQMQETPAERGCLPLERGGLPLEHRGLRTRFRMDSDATWGRPRPWASGQSARSSGQHREEMVTTLGSGCLLTRRTGRRRARRPLLGRGSGPA